MLLGFNTDLVMNIPILDKSISNDLILLPFEGNMPKSYHMSINEMNMVDLAHDIKYSHR